jgi:8-oxo-dGTP pyrophosphatase MutT (NUDIX family)
MHEYRVFFNDNLLRITSDASHQNDKNTEIYFYQPGFDWIPLINSLINYPGAKEVSVVAERVDFLWRAFRENFELIDAAGGLVFNELGEMLVIDRLGKWDLPKGKVEMHEKPEDTAIREIEEECGVRNLTVEAFLGRTYHVYTLQFRIILKTTYWFRIRTEKQKLTPQTVENIVDAFWLPKQKFSDLLERTYASIADFLGRQATEK